MSTSIDNRIVKMHMDTNKFREGARSAMNTLNELDKKLRLTDGVKGLSNIGTQFKNIDTKGFTDNLSNINNKFSVLDVVGCTALVNIANRAVDAGIKLVKSLTLDPVIAGFKEYELKMTSVQTIMSATGADIETVSNYLNDLNTYSDKTIYSFSDMTSAISKFANAGVSLDDSVVAIKGVANAAAFSGANANQASAAMYNFSQALANGYMGLADWNSISNTAQMGTLKFKQMLIETAEEVGTLVRHGEQWSSTTTNLQGKYSELFDASKGFTGSLQHQWMTGEVLVETLKKYTDETTELGQKATESATKVKTLTDLMGTLEESAQSGWAASWEIIFGNIEQSTKVWTYLNEQIGGAIGALAEYRNTNLQLWSDMGGRTAFLNGFKNILTGISKILTPIAQSFKEIIHPYNGEWLAVVSKGFEWLTSKLIISDKAAENIKTTFDGLFSILRLIWMVVQPIGGLIAGGATLIKPMVEGLVELTSHLGFCANKLRLMAEATGINGKLMEELSKYAAMGAESISKVMSVASEWISKHSWEIQLEVQTILAKLKSFFAYWKIMIRDFIADLRKGATEGSNAVSETFIGLKNGMSQTFDELKAKMAPVLNAFGTTFDRISNKISGFVNKVKSLFHELFQDVYFADFVHAGMAGGIALGIWRIAKNVKDLLKNFNSSFAALAQNVGRIAESLADSLDKLGETLETYQKRLKAEILKDIAISIGILVGSIWLLSKINPDRLAIAAVALGGVITAVMGSLKLFTMIDLDFNKFKGIISAGVLLISVGMTLWLASVAFSRIAKLDWPGIAKGIVGLASVVALIYGLLYSMNLFELTTLDPSIGKTLTKIAHSLWAIALSFKLMAGISFPDLIKSIIGISSALAAIGAFMVVVTKFGDASKMVNLSKSILPLAIGLLAIASAILVFSYISEERLKKGGLVLLATLSLLSIFANLNSKIKTNMVNLCTGLLILAFALTALTVPLRILGKMNIDFIIQGLTTMAGLLLVITGGLYFMPKNLPVIAIGLGLLAISLSILSGVLEKLGRLDSKTILVGLLAIVGILGTLGAIGTLLGMFAGPILAGAGALAVLGAASVAVGLGLIVLGTGLTALSGGLVALGAGLSGGIMALATSIPILAAAIAAGIVSFFAVISANIGPLRRAFTLIFKMIIEVVTDNIPVIKELIKSFLTHLLELIKEMVPVLIDTVMKLLMKLLTVLNEKLPQITNLILSALLQILQDLATYLPQIIKTIIDGLTNSITAFLDGIAKAIPQIVGSIVNIIVTIIETIADNTIRVVNAITDFVITIIRGLTNNIRTRGPEVRAAMKDLIFTIINEIKASFWDMASVGSYLMDGLKRGITNGINRVINAAKNVANRVVQTFKNIFDIHSPSRVAMGIGEYLMEGLNNGIVNSSGDVVKSTSESGNSIIKAMKDALNGELNSFDDPDLNPVITPVLDLSKIQNGVGNMRNMLDVDSSINASGRIVRTTSNKFKSMKDALSGISTTTNSNTDNSNNTINNTFNITSSDPNSTADAISKKIQKQYERRKAVWA